MRIIDIIDFIEKHKKGDMFASCPAHYDLAVEIDRASKAGTIFYATDLTGKISGMILADILPDKKEIYVKENLAMSISTLRLFAKKALATWPDYKLRWHKHGIYKSHNTEKVYKKLVHI